MKPHDWAVSEYESLPVCEIPIDEILHTWESVDGAHELTGDSAYQSWLVHLGECRKDYGYKRLLGSIRDHGLRKPFLPMRNSDGTVTFVDGHHRLAACIDLGYETVPCVFVACDIIHADKNWWSADKLETTHISVLNEIIDNPNR